MKRLLYLALAISAAAAATWLARRRAAGGRLEYVGPAPIDADAVGGIAEDAVIKARVETELFRDGTVPKGDVVVDVVAGVATVRGEVPPQLVEDLPVLISAVEGVVRVDSRLHAPGEEPPGDAV
ncbi:MAG TPA: BON domain-containing protein [Miltoncostaea sp.]|nr:BON domain-containing protein [Miltoncostaea sp.]